MEKIAMHGSTNYCSDWPSLCLRQCSMAAVRAATLVSATPETSAPLPSRITCQRHSKPHCQIRYASWVSGMDAPLLRRERSVSQPPVHTPQLLQSKWTASVTLLETA